MKRITLAIFAAVAALFGTAAPASAAPTGLARLNGSPVVRPNFIGHRGYFSDGAWAVHDIRWVSWGWTLAVGLGEDEVGITYCPGAFVGPTCLNGTSHRLDMPAVVVLDHLSGAPGVFTRITVDVPGLPTMPSFAAFQGGLTGGWYVFTFPDRWPVSLGGTT